MVSHDQVFARIGRPITVGTDTSFTFLTPPIISARPLPLFFLFTFSLVTPSTTSVLIHSLTDLPILELLLIASVLSHLSKLLLHFPFGRPRSTQMATRWVSKAMHPLLLAITGCGITIAATDTVTSSSTTLAATKVSLVPLLPPLYHNATSGPAWVYPTSPYDIGARSMSCECFNPEGNP